MKFLFSFFLFSFSLLSAKHFLLLGGLYAPIQPRIFPGDYHSTISLFFPARVFVQIVLDFPFVHRNAFCRYSIAYFGTKNNKTTSEGLSLGFYISPVFAFYLFVKQKNKNIQVSRPLKAEKGFAYTSLPYPKAVYQLLKHKVKPWGLTSVFPPLFLFTFSLFMLAVRIKRQAF